MNAHVTDTGSARALPRISLGALSAMADWKESIQGRIECARTRLNLGLPDNDANLRSEVEQFKQECMRLRRGVS